MSLEIHWHEGLFLQPHHLQRMQKSNHDQLSIERKLNWAYPYGVLEARLSRDELENMRVRFERLRAIMPSGRIVNFPESAELPSLDIKAVLEYCEVRAPSGAIVNRSVLDSQAWQDRIAALRGRLRTNF